MGDLGWEDPLEKGKATHSSILAWRLPGLYSPWGCKESDTTEQLSPSHDSLNLGMLYLSSADRFQLEYLNEAPEVCLAQRRWRDGNSGASKQVAGHLFSYLYFISRVLPISFPESRFPYFLKGRGTSDGIYSLFLL